MTKERDAMKKAVEVLTAMHTSPELTADVMVTFSTTDLEDIVIALASAVLGLVNVTGLDPAEYLKDLGLAVDKVR